MARVLLISSYVAHGTVGLQATGPALRHAGIELMTLPTTLLSNHPAHTHVAGSPVDPPVLVRMFEALKANGWLDGLAAVVTGYMPSADHVRLVAHLIDRSISRNPPPMIICDPVLGDDPKGLYVTAAVASAIRDHLLPRADVITPNRFELEWLSGTAVGTIDDAISAARRIGRPITAATSIPALGAVNGDDGSTDALANVIVRGSDTASAGVARRAGVPHGTGDVFTGLIAAELIGDTPLDLALTTATLTLDRIIEASGSSDALDLSEFFGSPTV